MIAQSSDYQTVEGNIYFPPSSLVNKSILQSSKLTTKCPWKGTASYYTLSVNGQQLKDAAWYYPEPKDAAKNIKDHVAFCTSRGTCGSARSMLTALSIDKTKVDVATA